MTALWRPRLDLGCSIEIDHTAENFGAHLHLDGDPELGPGDRVRVYGADIAIVPGTRRTVRRRAVVERATGLGRLWTRVRGRFEMHELYEVSFTDGRVA
jgi:hypothetical protein